MSASEDEGGRRSVASRSLASTGVVDAHHHLWDLASVDYPWLRARGERRFFGDPTPIQRDYGPEEFRDDWAGAPIAASVHIQVGTAPGMEVEETRWLERAASGGAVPQAIVAFADLTAPDLEQTLDAHLAASGRFRGVRQIVSRRADEDARSGTPALLEDPAFEAGLRIIAARGLSFDLQLTPPYLERAARLLSMVPDLKVALCHAGSPWDWTRSALRHWERGIVIVSELPGVSCKLSGFGMLKPDWTVAELEPAFAAVLGAFGAGRVMWGSNFPVDKLYRSYADTLAAAVALVPEAQRPEVFSATARSFYRL